MQTTKTVEAVETDLSIFLDMELQKLKKRAVEAFSSFRVETVVNNYGLTMYFKVDFILSQKFNNEGFFDRDNKYHIKIYPHEFKDQTDLKFLFLTQIRALVLKVKKDYAQFKEKQLQYSMFNNQDL